MLKKMFVKEHLVELDNIINNVFVLAECFIASEILKPKSEVMALYKETGAPLSLDIHGPTLIGENVESRGTILDSENRVISTMSMIFENGKVKRYEIILKGKLRGKKITLIENTDCETGIRNCCTLDVVNALKRLSDKSRRKSKC